MAGMAGEQVEGSEEAAALREGEESLVRHLETSRRRELLQSNPPDVVTPTGNPCKFPLLLAHLIAKSSLS